MRAIIPCAGFGTRMGMKPNESKELIEYAGKPLIQHTLDICYSYNLDPVIITRKEKRDLISYVKGIETVIIEPEGEWPSTILASQHTWDSENVLLLPDTLWTPTSIIQDIEMRLSLESSLVFGVHKVSSPKDWGHLYRGLLREKPTNWNEYKPGWAWGIIGFQPESGLKLFNSLRQHCGFRPANASYLRLDSFKDLTRGK